MSISTTFSEKLGEIFIKTLNRFYDALLKLMLVLFLILTFQSHLLNVQSQDTIDDTFESENHSYDIEYILKNYNVFSFGDIAASHINGPVIAQAGVFKLAQDSMDINIPSWNGAKSEYGVSVSDFSRDVPNNNSYIKGDYATTRGFTHAKRLYVGVENDNHLEQMSTNPNLEIVKSDHYLDWNKAYTNLYEQSLNLLSQSERTLSLDDIYTSEDGENYIIVKPYDNLLITQEVFDNYSYLVYISDSKPFDLPMITLNYDLVGTVIEKNNVVVADETAAQSGSINLGALYHSLAYDGYHPSGPYVNGDEKAINIIHNYPYAKTIINKTTQRFGQLVALNAEVYDNVGNVNGNMIVNAYYSPNSESHFWPLSNDVETPRLFDIFARKIDEDTQVPLANAKFGLFDENDTLLETILSDEHGSFAFRNLKLGVYKIKELEAPKGYKLNETIEIISFDDHSSQAISLVFENEKLPTSEDPNPKLYNIRGIKTDALSGDGLAGAQITLYNKDKHELASVITDADGTFEFKDLLLNDYYVKETIAPEGYELGDNEQFITLTPQSDSEIFIHFKNYPLEEDSQKDNHYFINGYKLDYDDDLALAQAEITLYDEALNILEVVQTDDDGFFEFLNLETGIYIVEETKAPEGYALGNNRVSVELSNETEYINLIFKNEKLEEPLLPDSKEPLEPNPKQPLQPDPSDSIQTEEDKPLIKTVKTGIHQDYLILFYSTSILLSLALLLKLKRRV